MAYKRKYKKSYRKKSRGKYTRKGRKSFKARVVQVLMKKVETKKYQFADENVPLYHNIGYTTTPLGPVQCGLSQVHNIWADINRGTASFNRIGDRITPRGMLLKFWIANKSDRPNVMYRLIVARVPKAINGTATTSINVDPWDDVQLGSNGNKLIRTLDKDRGIKALYDKVFSVERGNAVSGVSLKESHVTKKLWIKSKRSRDIVYDSTGSNQIVNNPIMVWLIPYDSYGTPQTDNVASCAYQGTIYYKDA